MVDIYYTEEIFLNLLNSLAEQIKLNYKSNFPVLLGVGISGGEMIGRLPQILGNEEIENYGVDVKRVGSKREVTQFPSDKVKGKRVLICYVHADTGNSLRVVAKRARDEGAVDVKTMTIAGTNNSNCYPNFFCSLINENDNIYLLVDNYPPDRKEPFRPYPPLISTPGDFVRILSNEDVGLCWFKCGDPRIDKDQMGDYLYYLKLSNKGKVFVAEKDNQIVGVLHFYRNSPETVRVETLASDQKRMGQHIGANLMLFLIDYCRYNGIRKIRLDAFKERESFYAKLKFKRVKSFSIPGYGEFYEMVRRV